MLEDTRERYAQAAEQHAEQYLAVITLAATEAGVACDALCVTSNHPYEAILQTAMILPLTWPASEFQVT